MYEMHQNLITLIFVMCPILNQMQQSKLDSEQLHLIELVRKIHPKGRSLKYPVVPEYVYKLHSICFYLAYFTHLKDVPVKLKPK